MFRYGFMRLCCTGMFIAVSSLFGLAQEPAAPEAPEQVKIVRVFFADEDALRQVAGFMAPWDINREKGYFVGEAGQAELDRLTELGFAVVVDQMLTESYNKPNQPLAGQGSGIPGFPCYPTVEETYAIAQDMVAANPGLAQWVDIGDSWEKTQDVSMGFDLMVLLLTNQAIPGPKPKLFITSSIHAREYTPAALNTAYGQLLINQYGVDPDLTWILDYHEVHLLLQANPDGRKRAETGLSWRKNTNNNFCPDTDVRGVDLNRNFEFQWGHTGSCSSGSACSIVFRGPGAGSEPETESIQNYERLIFPDQRGPDLSDPAPEDTVGVYLDIHSFGRLVLWPYGFDNTFAPNDSALQSLGRKLAFFNNYNPEKASQSFDTCGTTDDFAYGDLGVAAYTYELGTNFFQNCNQYETVILPDNLPSLIYAAKAAGAPYTVPSGPNIEDLALETNSGLVGAPLSLEAFVDDTRFNNNNGPEPVQNIAAAEFTVDLPPFAPGAVATALAPTDGSFDQTREGVMGVIDTAGLGVGRHTVFVRGQDVEGRWGAVSALYFELLEGAAPMFQGTVTEIGTGNPVAATIAADEFEAQADGVTGDYELVVNSGTYDLTVSAEGYVSQTLFGIVLAEGEVAINDFVLLPVCETVLVDLPRQDGDWLAEGTWGRTSETTWEDSPGSYYLPNTQASLTSPVFNVDGMKDIQLNLTQKWEIDPYGGDHGKIEYSLDGIQWVEIFRVTGFQPEWRKLSFPIPNPDGQAAVQFRFQMNTDSQFQEPGWTIGQLSLSRGENDCVIALLMENWPNSATVLDFIPVINGSFNF